MGSEPPASDPIAAARERFEKTRLEDRSRRLTRLEAELLADHITWLCTLTPEQLAEESEFCRWLLYGDPGAPEPVGILSIR